MLRRIYSLLLPVVLLAALLAALLPTQSVFAATFTVNTTNDTVDANPGNGVCADSSGRCSLRAAIMEANAFPGSDTVTVPPGTYLLTLTGLDNTSAGGDLDINSDITLTGSGAVLTIIQQTVSAERVIHVVPTNVTVSISSVTITGGNDNSLQGGGGIYNNGTLTISSSSITNNNTSRNGGGMYNDQSTFTLTNVTFRGNSAAGRGGALVSNGGNLSTITDSLFENNTASGTNSFDGGGAIHTDNDLTIQNSTFRNNTYNGDSHGGGAILSIGGTLDITGSLFEGNQGGGNGGGAIATSLDFFAPELIVTDSIFRNNQATDTNFGDGGALNVNGNAMVRDSTFENNRANGSALNYGNGGGIRLINGDLFMENVTLSGNRANGNGGGVYYRADSSAQLNNVTVASNIADADANNTGSGGGIFSTGDGSGSDVEMGNSILAGNTGGTGPDCSGFIDSAVGYNLIQTPGSSCTLGGTTTGNIIGQNPLLGPLANNGGPTPTRALLAGSPAIDAADPGASCAPTDQRGVARFDGNADSVIRCDMGAYEVNQVAPPPNSTAIPESLPATGFAMGRVTSLPQQPVEKAYTAYNDLVLEIPSLKVKAPIVGVLKAEGGWDVSWLGNSVGWLEGSAFPTWQGNTVLTAHVWNADNTPGTFANIKTLKYGDRFSIHAFGQTYIYEVRENSWLWGGSRVSKVFKHEAKDWVTLLTCEGYNPLTDNYLFRRMVRAVLVEVK